MRSKLLTREAALDLIFRDTRPRPATFNADTHTIEAVVATDAQVPRRDGSGAYMEILAPDGADLDALRDAPVLDSHRQNGLASVLGAVVDARREGGTIIATLQFSRRPEVAPIVADVQHGLLRHFSVGYHVEKWQDGRDTEGRRTRTAVRWTPREVSLVPVPADPNCRTRELDRDPANAGREQINRSIRELAQRAGAASTVTDGLIDRGATVEEARSAILDDMLSRGATGISATRHNATSLDNPEARITAMGEALHMRADPSHRPSEAARQFVGLTIPEMARDLLRRSGMSTSGMSAEGVITRALHTTSDFPLILGDTVGRTLRQSYSVPRSDIKLVARQTTAADFRKKTRIMLDSSGLTLERVNEHGEFKSGTMAESAESYKLDTFGRIISITRQALVNDDLGAFTDLSRRLGQAASSFESQFLVSVLTANNGLGPLMSDGATLFSAPHGNIAAVSGLPGQDTLAAGRLAMRRQTGASGGVISVTPKFLVVPPELETVGEKLITTIQAVVVENVNVFANLTLIVESRLTDPNRWYIVAGPEEIDGLEYAFLAGAPGPQIQTQVGFEIDGVQVKIRTDFGAAFVDWRGWYSNVGTAPAQP